MTTSSIASLVAVSAGLGHATEATRAPRDPRLHQVAREFESVMVRQMLASTHMSSSAGAYGDMASDALATGISDAGGMGLARQIEEAIDRSAARTGLRGPTVR